MKYRARSDILATILSIARDGAIKTRILYKANLSFPQLQEYLALLIKAELITTKKDEYVLTAKGIRYLDLHEELTSIAPELSVNIE